MNGKQNNLIERIRNLPYTKYNSDTLGVVCRLNEVSEEIRCEIGWLFEEYPYLGIFENYKSLIRPTRSAWQLSSSFLSNTLGDTYMGAEKYGDKGDYMWNYLEIGASCFDGGIGICADNDSTMFGKIAYITFDANSERGDIPIVANSFTEWLERILDDGPDTDSFYWYRTDFVDLGSAIPNDPSYRPIGRMI